MCQPRCRPPAAACLYMRFCSSFKTGAPACLHAGYCLCDQLKCTHAVDGEVYTCGASDSGQLGVKSNSTTVLGGSAAVRVDSLDVHKVG